MATVTITITELLLPPNLTQAITVSLYYKNFYDTGWTLIENNVPVNLDGTITTSPPPYFDADPTQKYVLRAVNQNCGYDYQQNLIISAYCPTGYTLSADGTYCYQQIIVSATPPTSPQNTTSNTNTNYTVWASLIYNQGFNINGTGTFTQIPFTNSFWVNGAGYPTGTGANTALGPMNRSGLWTSSASANQTLGYAICINAPSDGLYYVGCGVNNWMNIYLDGVAVLEMNPTAMGTYLSANGYIGVGVECTFRFWHIYPIMITAGEHILEIVGVNDGDTIAAMGTEVYFNTPAQIEAATSYSGLNLIFSSKDYIGHPVQLGNQGIGYSCPTGYALQYCNSPIVCVKTITVPILY